MKILLVYPPVGTKLSNVTPGQFGELDIGNYPPLGLMYVGAYLEKFSGHEVEILDSVAEGVALEDISEIIAQKKPDVIGVYTSCFTLYYAYAVSRAAKALNKEIPVVLGGPHVDIYPEETLGLPSVDYVVMGEGEVTVKELLNALQGNKDVSSIQGIGYKTNGTLHLNTRRDFISNLDELPYPARHLIDYTKYHSLIGKNSVSTTMMTSRGCPFRCNFCYVQYDGRVRARTADNVIGEIKQCLDIGIREFFLFDENFTINHKRVHDFCDRLLKDKLNIIFDIRASVNTVNEEILTKLKEAGCERIQFGVENGNPDILKAMNKKVSIDTIRKVFKAAKKVGISTYADFMLGYPGETKEHIMRTIDFAIELDPDFAQFGVTVLSPGTKIYSDALANGQLKEDFWCNLARNPTGNPLLPIATDRFTREEMEEFLSLAFSKFYFRPSYLFKRLTKVRSFSEFRKQTAAGIYLWLNK